MLLWVWLDPASVSNDIVRLYHELSFYSLCHVCFVLRETFLSKLAPGALGLLSSSLAVPVEKASLFLSSSGKSPRTESHWPVTGVSHMTLIDPIRRMHCSDWLSLGPVP